MDAKRKEQYAAKFKQMQDLETLDKLVFSNFESRSDMLEVMKIAYESGARNTLMETHPHSFDEWINEIKRTLDK